MKCKRTVALILSALICTLMLASCSVGTSISETAGQFDSVAVIQKAAEEPVAYTGDPRYIDTFKEVHVTADSGNSGNSDNGGSSGGNGGSSGGNGGSSGGNSSGGNSGGDVDFDDGPKEKDTSGSPIRMMSQNLRVATYNGVGDGDNNKLSLRQYRFTVLVNTYSPDVIATQEAGPDWIDALEHNQAGVYDMVWFWRSTNNKETTPALWKRDKYTVKESGHFWLSATPDVESNSYGEEGVRARICCWARLTDKATGVTFNFYSTHFGLGGGNVAINAGLQFAKMFATQDKGTYSFVLGDFNLAYNEAEYLSIIDYKRICDIYQVACDMKDDGWDVDIYRNGGSFCGFNQKYEGLNADGSDKGGGSFIDFIFAKPNAHIGIDLFRVLYDQPGDPSHNVSPGFVSDHFAILCDMRLNTTVDYSKYFIY